MRYPKGVRVFLVVLLVWLMAFGNVMMIFAEELNLQEKQEIMLDEEEADIEDKSDLEESDIEESDLEESDLEEEINEELDLEDPELLEELPLIQENEVFQSFVMVQSEPTYTEVWDGRGTDSLKCDMLGESPERTEDGWIHWIFSTKGESDHAELILGGTGSGTFEPAAPLNANTWHFFTPYFELEGLTATIHLFGGEAGPGGGLVISDFCPGVDREELTVSKTAKTSFTRTHDWSIEKFVKTENGFELNDLPKIWLFTDGSGDEKATWTVRAKYEGFVDSNFKVFGTVTIENTGTLDAVITGVEDLLAGELIDVDFPVTFPHTLAVGETLTGTYSEEVASKISGKNIVTVTTERDEYSAEASIRWRGPSKEINKNVKIIDESDLFGKVELGTARAYRNAKFTYSKEFKFEDFEKCGGYTFENIASVIGDKKVVLDTAEATLKVNVQCFVTDTAYAKGDSAISFNPTFSQWGWTNPILPGTHEMELWAGAAKGDTNKGTLAGSVTVIYDANGFVSATYNVDAPFVLLETHFYAGTTKFPQVQRGPRMVDTVAPGQYYNNSPFNGGQVYVIAHAVVGVPDPNFGP